jgi:HD-GYP domain-containing protein (c-di-GMP phosphodiesterase class II)
VGYRILSLFDDTLDLADYVYGHHERWDGKGYPDGLAATDIPLLSRILIVADCFDAMSSDRAYRKALPIEQCIEELIRNKGTQFDPDIVDASLSILRENSVQEPISIAI